LRNEIAIHLADVDQHILLQRPDDGMSRRPDSSDSQCELALIGFGLPCTSCGCCLSAVATTRLLLPGTQVPFSLLVKLCMNRPPRASIAALALLAGLSGLPFAVVQAQAAAPVVISGKVTAADGTRPLQGVSVVLRGTRFGTLTNAAGT
jgi:hypothetical protein